ncbi:PR5-like receptor kinase [Arachis hypogaea]|uniref:PR5-like receptor kinase n=1 Tax=Arachis hypogaea TaxID=3818 RepID=UPI000DED0BE9|nr:PR5-like receptor kinase [Arachis hypogaea]
MPKLVEVNLEGNSIEGSIPDLSNSTSLQYLLLANNRLMGVVPPFLGLLNNISQVSLENNWLQGPLPAFNKSRAPKLNFTSNRFCLDHPGPCDHRVITLLQVAQTLYYPFLLAQSWRGNNPCQDWNFITCDDKGNIRTVNLTNLNLTGTISLSFKNLTVLEGLYLGGNRLNGISVGVGVIVMIFVAISYYCKRHFSRIMLNKETSLVRQFGEQINNATLVRYTYAEVEQMTNSFQEELGKGGFGIVYKGCLNDGCQLAVKILKEMKGSAEEFVNEVVTISRTSHVNIVSLLEFCYEMNKQALIYEFMSKGSLDKYKCKEGSSELDWKTLLQIVTGVAQGLDYLHRGCNTRILHFDIKPQNMLLDEKFCPKITDFGLARICKKDESVVSILDRRGIPGYISPEMFSRRNGRVSHKSDVYSYGMLILKMIGGNDNYDIGESHSTEYFSDWILKDIKEDKIRLLRFASGKDDEDIIKKILFVGLWCIQMNSSDRPKMCKVVEMLQGKLELISLESIISSPTVPLLQHSDASHS